MELIENIEHSHADIFPSGEATPIKLNANYLIVKRVFDICLVLLLLPLVLLVMGGIALLIKLDSRGPIFFHHIRIGKNGKAFKCYKFRTMIKNAEAVLNDVLQNPQARKEWEKDFKLKDDPRITRIGKILRKSSLDELPQFFNVLRGNMSFVGPRPIVEKEIPLYGGKFNFYKTVTPGITGLWQISGRSDTTYNTRIRLDQQYVESMNLLLDIQTLLKTIPAVVLKRGAY